MTADEKLVRDSWEDLRHSEVYSRFLAPYFACSIGTAEAAWSAAARFTEERLEQIRELEEEIAWLESLKYVTDVSAAIRTLRRAESALADLKRGMK